ncbi:MAG TPA: AAA family ATPase [Anaerolineae bacterium]|nr:AAA family ATPase [Anaerolineae bacterium]
MTTHGLTLGKYAPFHEGHQLVIDTALAEMDQLTVIIYDAPDTTHIPLPVRANWIRQLYPHINLILAWDGPTAVGNTPAIQQAHEDYILNILGPTTITHFYSSEFYGDHMSRALNAINRQVDPQRHQRPISATKIRSNPYHYRHHLDPLVYRDLITNVVFLGAPSTGKTSIAQTMAQTMHTVWMPEYGREYWEKHQIERRLTTTQLIDIAHGHLQREQQHLTQANRYLFTDTNALTTAIFCQYYHHHVPAELAQLATNATTRYDLIFLCDTDIPYDDTWDRSGDANRQLFQKMIRADLAQRHLPYYTLSGPLDQRVTYVQTILNRHQKYQNPLAPYIT